jgi:phosphopantetheine--protein transferase-like protein
MTRVQIALSIAKDFTSLNLYSRQEETEAYADLEAQRQWGMIFTWIRPKTSLRRLVCVGLDICGTRRWERMLSRTPEVAARAFTDSEQQWADAQPERLARLWTIKEALAKALGCGFAGLAYQDIAIEFAPRGPIIRLPATVPAHILGEQEISNLSWQLLLFGEQTLPGALILAWKHVSDCVPAPSFCHVAQTNSIVLELRAIPGVQRNTRREQHAVEHLVARQAAYSAATRLLPFHTHQLLAIRKTQSGQPILQVTGRDLVITERWCLSLSHCSGWAAAALGGIASQQFLPTEDALL